jgi:hypothetical protein
MALFLNDFRGLNFAVPHLADQFEVGTFEGLIGIHLDARSFVPVNVFVHKRLVLPCEGEQVALT